MADVAIDSAELAKLDCKVTLITGAIGVSNPSNIAALTKCSFKVALQALA